MKAADQIHRLFRWSEKDQAYIGYFPDLYSGGACHGDREEAVYSDLCGVVRDEIEHRLAKGRQLPPPLVRSVRGLK